MRATFLNWKDNHCFLSLFNVYKIGWYERLTAEVPKSERLYFQIFTCNISIDGQIKTVGSCVGGVIYCGDLFTDQLEPLFKVSWVRKWSQIMFLNQILYTAFHRFGSAKIRNGGSALGLSQFSLLPQNIFLGKVLTLLLYWKNNPFAECCSPWEGF